MKKIFLWGFLVLFVGCTTSNKVKISGTIQQATPEDVVVIGNELVKSSDTISLQNGKFVFEKSIEQPGFYSFKCGKSGFRMFLEPGDHFNMDIDIDEVKSGNLKSIGFTGEGFANTRFMFHLFDMQLQNSLRDLLKQPSDSFLNIVTANYDAISSSIDSFEHAENVNPYFLERIKIIQKAQYANPFLYYVQYHKRLAPADTSIIPELFYTVGNDIPLDNADYFTELTEYQYYVVRKYDYEMSKGMENKGIEEETIDAANYKIDFVTHLSIPQTIKDVLGLNILSSYTYENQDVKDVYEQRYSELVKDDTLLKDFLKEVQAMKALKPGSEAPVFAYEDINGEKVSLKDFIGKVVYVDVWATWCGPCKGQLPFMKKLEEDLHDKDIAFVSVSVDKDKGAWEKMVHDKDLKGYQLFSDNAWESSITKDYVIRAIPRFMMIDKKGMIVNVNATQPSNPETKEQLLKLSKM